MFTRNSNEKNPFLELIWVFQQNVGIRTANLFTTPYHAKNAATHVRCSIYILI